MLDALLWHANLNAPRKVHIRPHHHGALEKANTDLDLGAEVHRWFDYWLKDIDNGIMNEPPIHYVMLDAAPASRWRTAAVWPPTGSVNRAFYLSAGPSGTAGSSNDGMLVLKPPDIGSPPDLYEIDYTVTTGRKARWNAIFGAASYGDLAAHDDCSLTYPSGQLSDDLEVIGHPIVRLWIDCEAEDTDIFVYLEEVTRRRSRYVTEGQLRSSHRAKGAAEWQNHDLPFHPCTQALAASLEAGGPTELEIRLLPIAKRLRRGSHLRLTVACSDADNFEARQQARTIRLHVDSDHASSLSLPIAEPSISSLPLESSVSPSARSL